MIVAEPKIKRRLGSWLRARKDRRCERIGCTNIISQGAMYFDTQEPNPRHGNGRATVCICAACVIKEIK